MAQAERLAQKGDDPGVPRGGKNLLRGSRRNGPRLARCGGWALLGPFPNCRLRRALVSPSGTARRPHSGPCPPALPRLTARPPSLPGPGSGSGSGSGRFGRPRLDAARKDLATESSGQRRLRKGPPRRRHRRKRTRHRGRRRGWGPLVKDDGEARGKGLGREVGLGRGESRREVSDFARRPPLAAPFRGCLTRRPGRRRP